MATTTTTKISFYQCTLKQYKALSSTDPAALYFVTDAGQIYKGDYNVTRSLEFVESWTISKPIADRIYFNTVNGEARTYHNNQWYVIVPPMVNSSDDFKDSTKQEYLASVKAIKEYVTARISNTISKTTEFVRDISYVDGSLFVNNGSATPVKEIKLTGVAHDPSYNASTLTIKIPVYGQDDLVINLPKDSFVKSGRYESNYLLPDGTYGPAIVLVVGPDGAEEEVVIPAAALVNIYKGSKTPSVTVNVADGTNVISASVNISKVAGNGIIEKGDGLYVKVSDFVNKAQVTKDVVLVSDGNGGFTGAEGDVKIVNSGDLFDLNHTHLATANVIAAAITAAIQTATAELEPRVAALENRFTDFTENEVLIGVGNKVTSSGVTIGGSKIADNPSDKVLATEAAVAQFGFDWGSIPAGPTYNPPQSPDKELVEENSHYITLANLSATDNYRWESTVVASYSHLNAYDLSGSTYATPVDNTTADTFTLIALDKYYSIDSVDILVGKGHNPQNYREGVKAVSISTSATATPAKTVMIEDAKFTGSPQWIHVDLSNPLFTRSLCLSISPSTNKDGKYGAIAIYEIKYHYE